MRVPEVDNEPERTYTFAQLIDLNDKLTLVVGKDEEQQSIIKYFEDVNKFFCLILLKNQFKWIETQKNWNFSNFIFKKPSYFFLMVNRYLME